MADLADNAAGGAARVGGAIGSDGVIGAIGAEPEGPAVEADWLDPDEMRAWRTYIEASDRLQGVLNRSLQSKHGMTMDDYRILVFLSEAPERSLRMSDIADGIVASRSKLTHQIRRLEAAGMVVRAGCASDKRGVLATLTDEGLLRLERAAPDHVADVRQFMIDAMTARQLKALGDAFVKVGNLCQGSAHSEAAAAKSRGGKTARR